MRSTGPLVALCAFEQTRHPGTTVRTARCGATNPGAIPRRNSVRSAPLTIMPSSMPAWISLFAGGLALLLVLLLGFASQRAGVCTVNAVAEVMTTRRAFLLVSFFKAALWAAAIFALVTMLAPGHSRGFQVYAPPLLSLLGGFVFGAGAAINGGCSMSTLHRLADGDLWMGLTLGGMAMGFLLWSLLDASLMFAHARELPVVWGELGAWAAPVALIIATAAIGETVRLWRSRPRDLTLVQLIAAPSYRLSTAALLIGVSGGVLYGLKGMWSYTNYLRASVEAAHRHTMGPGVFQLLLLVSLLAGMVLSGVLRRSFRVRSVPVRIRVRRLAGGALMGLGAAAIPGGNDALLLTGLPTLSVWALGVYLSLLAGVAAVLLMLRGTPGGVPHVECTGDVCHEGAIR